MSHFSHPPLQVYRRCRLKIYLQIMIILACLQKINVLCTNPDSLPGYVLMGTQLRRRAAGLCFQHALERAGHQKSHISKCLGTQASIRCIFNFISTSRLATYSGNLFRLRWMRPNTRVEHMEIPKQLCLKAQEDLCVCVHVCMHALCECQGVSEYITEIYQV